MDSLLQWTEGLPEPADVSAASSKLRSEEVKGWKSTEYLSPTERKNEPKAKQNRKDELFGGRR